MPSVDRSFAQQRFLEFLSRKNLRLTSLCEDCEKIVEFESDKIAKIEDEISQELGFSIRTQRLQISGTCVALKRLGACKNKHR